MSSEIYELMKRSDEVEVVEKAHMHPRFVEDCVREMVRMAVDEFAGFGEDAFLLARQENLETIHKHNVVAERHGLIGELRPRAGASDHRAAPRDDARVARGQTPASAERPSAGSARAPIAWPAADEAGTEPRMAEWRPPHSIPLSQDAALVAALAGTAMPFAHSAEDQAERWLRALRLHGQRGRALQALGVGEAPLMTARSRREPRRAGTRRPRATWSTASSRARRELRRRSAPAASAPSTCCSPSSRSTATLIDRALYLRGASRDELLERLAEHRRARRRPSLGQAPGRRPLAGARAPRSRRRKLRK